MQRERTRRIAIWTVSLGLVGMFLGLGKGPLLLSKVTTAVEGLIGGGLIGFGFGITFARPRNAVERRLKIIYAALPFGIIGALVGKALGIEDAPIGTDPGLHPTMMGALCGIAAGIAVGTIVYFSARSAVDGLTPADLNSHRR
jgi:hypothetical protein